MSVHMVQFMASPDVAISKVRGKAGVLRKKYGERLEGQNSLFSKSETMDGEVSFFQGGFRVNLSDKESEKTDLMKQIRKEMDKSSSWWQIRYHVCSHTESNPSPCSWETIEYSDESDVPDEVKY